MPTPCLTKRKHMQCWILLTILTAFSFRPIRNRYYEFFYWSHVLLVILVLVTAILHHRVTTFGWYL